MGKGLYSAGHDNDYENRPPKKGRRKKQKGTSVHRSATTLFEPGTPAPTEEQRQQLRKAQVAKGRDKDLLPEHRRRYRTQGEGVHFSEPHVLPPREELRRTQLLPGDPDFLEEDIDLLLSLTASDGDRIAELSVTDQAVVQVDNSLTEAFRVARNLLTAAQQMRARAQQEANVEASHHSEQITWILEEAVIPWLQEVDDHLEGVIQATPEGRQVQEQEGGQPQQPQIPQE